MGSFITTWIKYRLLEVIMTKITKKTPLIISIKTKIKKSFNGFIQDNGAQERKAKSHSSKKNRIQSLKKTLSKTEKGVTKSLPELRYLSSENLRDGNQSTEHKNLDKGCTEKWEYLCQELITRFKDELNKPEQQERLSVILDDENIDFSALALEFNPENTEGSKSTFEHGQKERRSLQERAKSLEKVPDENTTSSCLYCLPCMKWLTILLTVIVVFLILHIVRKKEISQKQLIEFVPSPRHYQGIIKLPTQSNTVEWISRCPTKQYSHFLSKLERNILDFGAVQVDNELWVCGGRTEDIKTETEQDRKCQILNLLDGQWRTFEHEMNYPRLKSWMFVEGRRVIVRSGVTTDIFSSTGCRDTQEVFHKDKPELGWSIEQIEETKSCDGLIENFNINCL